MKRALQILPSSSLFGSCNTEHLFCTSTIHCSYFCVPKLLLLMWDKVSCGKKQTGKLANRRHKHTAMRSREEIHFLNRNYIYVFIFSSCFRSIFSVVLTAKLKRAKYEQYNRAPEEEAILKNLQDTQASGSRLVNDFLKCIFGKFTARSIRKPVWYSDYNSPLHMASLHVD